MAEGILSRPPARRLWEPALAVGTGALAAALLAAASVAASPVIGMVLVVSFAAGLAIIAFSPVPALLAMAFVVPLERLGRFGDDLALETFSLMRLVGLATLAAVLIHMIVRRQPLTWSAPLTLCAVLQTMAVVSIFYALDPDATQAEALTMLGGFLMLFTVAQGVRDWRMLDGMILTWLAATLAIGVYQVYDWHFGIVLGDGDAGRIASRFATTINALSESNTLGAVRRAIGTTSNFAVYGINLLLATPFLFYRLHIARSPAAKLFWSIAIGLIFYNLLLTNTRAVLIFAVLLYLMIAATGLFRITPARVALSGIVVIAVIPFLPQSIWDRILNVHAYELDQATNLTWRFELWEAALRLGAEHWLTGIGVGNRTAIISGLDPMRFEGEWIMAHNEFLQVFTELGIFGLTVFVAFLVSIIWKSWTLMKRFAGNPALERHRAFAAAALCSLVIAPLFGLQVDVFHFPLKGWWLVAGLVLVADRLSRGESRSVAGRLVHVAQ